MAYKYQTLFQVGNDMFGEANIQSIKSFGTDASLIQKSDSSHTGTATISVNEEGKLLLNIVWNYAKILW